MDVSLNDHVFLAAISSTVMMPSGYSFDRAWVTVADKRDIVFRIMSCGDANVAMGTYLGNTKVISLTNNILGVPYEFKALQRRESF